MVKVGDSFFIIRRNSRQKPFFDIVVKVGRKYFFTQKGLKFEIESLKNISEYGGEYTLYLSEQEYLDEVKKRELWFDFIRSHSYAEPSCTLGEMITALQILRGS